MGQGLLSLLDGEFDPRDVGGLVFWLDASDYNTTTLSSSAVTAWLDKSNGISMAPPAAGQRPAVGVNAYNRRIVDNDHIAGDLVKATAPSSLANVFDGGGYVALIARINSDGGSDTGRLLDKNQWFLDFREESGGNVKFNFKHEFSTSRYVCRSSSANISTTGYRIIDWGYDNGSVSNTATVFVDAAAHSTTTATTPVGTRVSDSSDDFAVGGQYSGGTGVSADAFIGEVLIFDRIPSDYNKGKIRAYLKAKWGV